MVGVILGHDTGWIAIGVAAGVTGVLEGYLKGANDNLVVGVFCAGILVIVNYWSQNFKNLRIGKFYSCNINFAKFLEAGCFNFSFNFGNVVSDVAVHSLLFFPSFS